MIVCGRCEEAHEIKEKWGIKYCPICDEKPTEEDMHRKHIRHDIDNLLSVKLRILVKKVNWAINGELKVLQYWDEKEEIWKDVQVINEDDPKVNEPPVID